MFDVNAIRQQFPILKTAMRGKPMVYLDSSATSQKPQCVIDAVTEYYEQDNANVHRGVYELSERATLQYEGVRNKAQQFINANTREEIIFTRGTTEAINLVAFSYGEKFVTSGDEVLISGMEHHSNIVPWQMLCERKGAKLNVIPVLDDGTLDKDAYKKLLTKKTKIVAIAHVSNVLGTINPIKEMVALAHQKNIPVLIDGAQGAPHMKLDMQDIDCDFYAFSSHKMYGPTGVGVLFGKKKWLEAMPPYQGGGDMISTVSFEKTKYNVVPLKFESGTPSIAQVIGLGAAIDFLNQFDLNEVEKHEEALVHYCMDQLKQMDGLKIIGNSNIKTAAVSFVMDDAHSHDIASILDAEGIAVRGGHHCAMPLMQRFNVPATTRASFGIYNTKEDVDKLILGLKKVKALFS